MAWETEFQSPFESFQRLEKLYLMSPCLTLSIKRYVSRVNRSNTKKKSRTPLDLGGVAMEKRAFRSSLTTVPNFTYIWKSNLSLNLLVQICPSPYASTKYVHRTMYLYRCYICVSFQLVAFVREHIWHKALLMEYLMRLEITLVSSFNDLGSVRCFI